MTQTNLTPQQWTADRFVNPTKPKNMSASEFAGVKAVRAQQWQNFVYNNKKIGASGPR